MKKQTVDTNWEGSWAHGRFLETHDVKVSMNFMGNKTVTQTKKPDAPLPDWFGKPSIIGNLANAIPLNVTR